MTRIATQKHPYSPENWLSRPQTEDILKANGISRSCTIGFCEENGISLGGHDRELYIRKLALDQFIERCKREYLESTIGQCEIIELLQKDILQYRGQGTGHVENIQIIYNRVKSRLRYLPSLEEIRPLYKEIIQKLDGNNTPVELPSRLAAAHSCIEMAQESYEQVRAHFPLAWQNAIDNVYADLARRKQYDVHDIHSVSICQSQLYYLEALYHRVERHLSGPYTRASQQRLHEAARYFDLHELDLDDQENYEQSGGSHEKV